MKKLSLMIFTGILISTLFSCTPEQIVDNSTTPQSCCNEQETIPPPPPPPPPEDGIGG
ncbi:MAG: hypothetical protein ACJA1Z_001145 [Patiriisocius sp.]|jgi:hypothetical protein|uniref:hypothetical protein n=1 Tax=Nonlabens sp. TaxID=1888209 RepID=UPI0039E68AC7